MLSLLPATLLPREALYRMVFLRPDPARVPLPDDPDIESGALQAEPHLCRCAGHVLPW